MAIEVLQRQINARLETRIDQHAQVLERHEALLDCADEALAAIRALLERLLHPPANGY
jgi:hypothetical protein